MHQNGSELKAFFKTVKGFGQTNIGPGEIKYSNGDTYSGLMYKGQFHGPGKFKSTEFGVVIHGIWQYDDNSNAYHEAYEDLPICKQEFAKVDEFKAMI